MNARFTALLAVFVLSASALAAPSPVAMFIPKAINVEPAQLDALGAVCALQYGRVAQQSVLAPAQSQAAIGANGSLTDAARSLGATELIELTVVNLGTAAGRGRLLLSAVRRTVEGAELYRTDLTADSLDDVPVACERLALSLTRGVSFAETRGRRTVTAAEARAGRHPNRVGSEHLFGLKAGFGTGLAIDGQVNPMGSLGFDVRLEQERYFLELGAGFLVPANVTPGAASYGGITTELGASYYLTAGDTAPYVGLGVQPRLIFSGSILNLAPYAQLGLMFSRELSTRLYVDLRVSQNLLPVASYGGGNFLYPTEVVGQLGIAW